MLSQIPVDVAVFVYAEHTRQPAQSSSLLLAGRLSPLGPSPAPRQPSPASIALRAAKERSAGPVSLRDARRIRQLQKWLCRFASFLIRISANKRLSTQSPTHISANASDE